MGNIERVQDRKYNLDTLDNTIMSMLDQFKLDNNIEDMRKEPPATLNAFFCEVKQLFRNNKYLLHTENNVNNAYDYDKINQVMDIYIEIALLHDAPISEASFSLFSGIPFQAMAKWKYETTPRGEATSNIRPQEVGIIGRKDGAQSVSGLDLWKKLNYYSVFTWEQTKKLNDLRVIAVLNKITGGEYREYKQIETDATTQDRHEIAQKYINTPVIENIKLPE